MSMIKESGTVKRLAVGLILFSIAALIVALVPTFPDHLNRADIFDRAERYPASRQRGNLVGRSSRGAQYPSAAPAKLLYEPSPPASAQRVTTAGSNNDEMLALQVISAFVAQNPDDSLAKLVSLSQTPLLTLRDYFNYFFESDNDDVRYQCIRLAQISAIQTPSVAKQLIDWIIEQDPSNFQAYRIYSAIFEQEGDPHGFGDLLNKKIMESPELSSEIRLVLIDYYIERGERDQAIVLLQQELSGPTPDDYHNYLLNYLEENPI